MRRKYRTMPTTMICNTYGDTYIGPCYDWNGQVKGPFIFAVSVIDARSTARFKKTCVEVSCMDWSEKLNYWN